MTREPEYYAQTAADMQEFNDSEARYEADAGRDLAAAFKAQAEELGLDIFAIAEGIVRQGGGKISY